MKIKKQTYRLFVVVLLFVGLIGQLSFSHFGSIDVEPVKKENDTKEKITQVSMEAVVPVFSVEIDHFFTFQINHFFQIIIKEVFNESFSEEKVFTSYFRKLFTHTIVTNAP